MGKAWQPVHGVAQNRTQLKRLNTSTHHQFIQQPCNGGIIVAILGVRTLSFWDPVKIALVPPACVVVPALEIQSKPI